MRRTVFRILLRPLRVELSVQYSVNRDAVVALEAERGKHRQYCFTYRGQPIRWELTNSAWHTAIGKAGIADFRFHDLRHTWASWHRQAGTSCDELKDLGG